MMAHKTQTTVTHWFDFTEAEVFDASPPWVKYTGRWNKAVVKVTDGSTNSVVLYGNRVLKSGELGTVADWSLYMFGGYPPNVVAILRAHGIPCGAAA